MFYLQHISNHFVLNSSFFGSKHCFSIQKHYLATVFSGLKGAPVYKAQYKKLASNDFIFIDKAHRTIRRTGL